MFSLDSHDKTTLPSKDDALEGRDDYAFSIPDTHYVLGTSLKPPYPEGTELATFGMGCFWGAEQLFWEADGVVTTAVGYAGGHTPHPTYREVCSAQTGHAEVVRVVFEPDTLDYETLLQMFWEEHDPTQGMRQGNDVGTQYRSAIYWHDESQRERAESSREAYQRALHEAGRGDITTEMRNAPDFYFAEPKHQQYLAKNPGGYCGLQGTGVSCPGDPETSD
jgi:peptide-methionine (S)-S-oxide reductase